MHKSEARFPENEMHKILWDLEIQTDHSIPGQSSDLVLIDSKKITCTLVDFAVPVDHGMKIKRHKYLHLACDP